MSHLLPTSFTLLFEQTNHGAFIGCIEEIPELIRVKGDTFEQARRALYNELRLLFVHLPHPENIRIQTRVRLWLTRAKQARS
ncbi:MAG: hypothetical protein H7Z75_08045 [Ferruginibacter sp.]|nr:hypothetical protein [Cytophagales bacterium]